MLDRERLPVHGVGKKGLRAVSVVYAQATFEANWLTIQIKFSAVGASKYYLSRARFNSRSVQNLRKWHASPFGCADSAQVPLLPIHTRAQQLAAIPAHSKVTNWVWEGIFIMARKLRLRGRSTKPTTFTRQLDESSLGT